MPSDEAMHNMIPVLAKILDSCTMHEILIDAMWSLSYCSDAGKRTVPEIMETGIVPRVIQLMMHENSSIAIPALRACGNFVTGTDEQTSMVIREGVLHAIDSLLGHSEMMIRKETVWTLSNICAGSVEHLKQVIDLGLIDKLVVLARTDGIDVQREAVWSISNATALKNKDIIQEIV